MCQRARQRNDVGRGAPANKSRVRTGAIVVIVSSVGSLPVMLVGGLAVLLEQELAFGETQLGLAVAAFFAAGAITATSAGRLAERVGPRSTVWLGLACTGSSLLGIAIIAGSWTWLVAFLILGGIGITVIQVGVNVLLARVVAARRQGLAFGVAQAAIPLAALLAGLAVPTIGLALGWRSAFLLGAAIAPVAAAMMPSVDYRAPIGRRLHTGEIPREAFGLLTIGMALAVAGGTSSAAFVVAFAVDRGLRPPDAGLVLAAGSVAVVIARIGFGWAADRSGRSAMVLVMILVAVGAVGYTGLAFVGKDGNILVFATLAFGGGWGWVGLFLLAVSRLSPAAPGPAFGIVYTGLMAGALVGPLVFGILAEAVAFSAAWLMMAAMALTGACLMVLGRRRTLLVRPDLARRW